MDTFDTIKSPANCTLEKQVSKKKKRQRNENKKEEKRQVGMNDLYDEVLSMILNQMSVTGQIAVSRVAKRFDNVALKSVQSFRPEEEQVPESKLLELVMRMPNLKMLFLPGLPRQAELTDKILAAIASSKRAICGLLPINLSMKYLNMAIKSNPMFDGSKLTVGEKFYETMTKEYPNVKLRYCIWKFGSGFNPTTRSDYERLTDPNLAKLELEPLELPFDFMGTLSLAKNITVLAITIVSKPDYGQIFDSAAQLQSLERFFLGAKRLTDAKWKKQDLDSFKKMIEIPTLMDISLFVQIDKEQYDEALEMFLECPRDNCKVFIFIGLFPNDDQSPIDFYSPYKGKLCMVLELGTASNFPLVKFMRKFRPKYRQFVFKSCDSLEIACALVKDLVINEPKFTFSFLLKTKSVDTSIPPVYDIIRPIDIINKYSSS